MYHPYSRISSAWSPLVSKEVGNREIQVDLMCSSSSALIFCELQVFFSVVAAMAQYSMWYSRVLYISFNELDFDMV